MVGTLTSCRNPPAPPPVSEPDRLAARGAGALREGDLRTADRLYRDSLQAARKSGDGAAAARALHHLALVALAAGQPEEARLWVDQIVVTEVARGRLAEHALLRGRVLTALDHRAEAAEALASVRPEDRDAWPEALRLRLELATRAADWPGVERLAADLPADDPDRILALARRTRALQSPAAGADALRQAAEQARRAGWPRTAARAYGEAAEAALAAGRAEAALDAALEAAQLHHAFGRPAEVEAALVQARAAAEAGVGESAHRRLEAFAAEREGR
jgi:hypothetical protein